MIQRTAARALISTLARAIGWVLFALLLLLCVLPKGSTRVFTWPWVFYAQLLLLSPFLLAGWVQIKSTPGRPAGGGALAFCALSIGLSVVLSRNPHFSFEAALYLWAGLGFIWWLACQLHEATSSDERFRRAARIAGIALTAPAISSLWQWIGGIAPTLAAADTLGEAIRALGSARNQSPFGHPNYTAGYALLALPWFVSLVRVERGGWRMGWMAAALLCLLLIFSSGSRGALLGALALVVTFLALGLVTRQISPRTGLWSLVAGVVLVVLLGATNTRVRTLLTEPSGLRYPNVGDVQRLGMLQGGWLLGKQRPWVGHGPGMVPFVYPTVRAQLVGGVETSYQLHNAFLHQWVITGLIGMAGGLALTLSLVRALRRWLREPAGMPRTFALNSAAALVGYAAMAATDYQLDVIGILAALCLPTALLLAAPPERVAQPVRVGPALVAVPPESALSTHNIQHSTLGSGSWRKLFGILLIGTGLAAAAFLVPHWQARQLHWSAWVETTENDRAGLLAKLIEASRTAPWNTHYRNQLGLQLGRDALESNQPEQRRIARDVLFSSLAYDVAQEPIHANLAWLWLPDNPNHAGVEFSRALALIPDRDTLHHGLAISRLNTGDETGAVRALALEFLVNPPFIASPVWARPELAALYEQVNTQLGELISRASNHPAMPRWRQRDLAYFVAFLRWWNGGPAPTVDELAGADARQRGFFAAAASDSSAASSWPLPWQELTLVDRNPGEAGSTLRLGGGNEAARDGAIARRKAEASSIPELVRSEPPPNVGIIGFTNERAHYPLMHRNLDGPGYLDLAPRVADAFRQRYAEPLFPARGLIPGPVLKDIRLDGEL